MQRARERDIAFVFQLFALYPHMNVRKNIGFPLLAQGMPKAEIRARVEEDGEAAAHRPSARQAGVRACRRRPPARRARPRHRAPAEVLPDGRAARHARHRVPRSDGARAARAAQPHRRHHRLCHARPDGSHVDGRQDRGDEPRHHRAVRHAAGNLRPPGHDVRRRLHRLAADELPGLPAAASRKGAQRGRRPGRQVAVPEVREDVAPGRPGARRPARAHPPRRQFEAARRGATAPNISAPRRSSPSRPRTAWSRRACRPSMRCRAWASRSGLALSGARLSLFDKAIGRAIEPRFTTEAAHG